MKKIINEINDIVVEMCKGFVIANPELSFNEKYKIIAKKEPDRNKVILISGGGSGHEPSHGGFVGKGMLDAAVCGDVFASPSQIQVYKAIKENESEKGTLLIIKNYSGDVMNFKNAAALAIEDGMDVDYVKVEDDVAVEDSLYTVGRRGVAGTVFVHKIAGAAAQKGENLAQVKRIAQKTADNVRSIGFALDSCTVPAKGTPTFKLNNDEIEYGVGIHGEPGVRREKMKSAKELATMMIEAVLKDFNLTNYSEKEFAVIINGFGATPLQELYLLNNSVMECLAEYDCQVYRCLVGNYMTSIDMAGASVSVLLLDEELKDLLDYECRTPSLVFDGQKALQASFLKKNEIQIKEFTQKKYFQGDPKIIENLTFNNLVYIVYKMTEIILQKEVEFCELDSHAGDGDFGMSLAKGFRILKQELPQIVDNSSNDAGKFLSACSLIIMEYCGGATGPLWGSAFRAASQKVEGKKEITLPEFYQMLISAIEAIQSTGERSFGRGAVVGDKTIIDALIPCAEAWAESVNSCLTFKEAFLRGAQAAVIGAKNTEKITAKMGRAGTVGERSRKIRKCRKD